MSVNFTAPKFQGGDFARRLTQIMVSIKEAFRRSALDSDIIGRAGPGNVSKYVYEEIDGREYIFKAVDGNESLEMLPSDHENNAQDHWSMFGGGWFDYNQSVAHHYKEGMIIFIKVYGAQYRVFSVKHGATVAQLRVNPTDDEILPADVVFLPLVFV